MNFRQVRKKIKTIGNVKQITKAMQMVSSVKMKKAQTQAVEGRVYRDFLDAILQKMLGKADLSDLDAGFLMQKDASSDAKDLYIIVSSNKGLCGSFNINIFKTLLTKTDTKKSEYITIGKKAADFLVRAGATVTADFSQSMPLVSNVSAVFSMAKKSFASGNYKSVHLVYNRFISTIKHETVITKLFPLSKEELVQENATEKKSAQAEYAVEPSPKEVFESLIIDYLEGKIRQAILDSEAAEHSARMMAMKNATDSAQDLIYNLTLLRNKLRQATITNELLDITTAKESAESVTN